jgi:transposase
MAAPTHVYTVTLDRTIAQRAIVSVYADDLDHAIRLALDAVKRKDTAIVWRHHATASAPAVNRDLVIDTGEPDPVLPFRGPGVL